jgi:hypothetical protein
LKGVETKVIPTDIFYQWSEKTKKKGGQVKIPKVMKEGEFVEFEKFVKEQFS